MRWEIGNELLKAVHFFKLVEPKTLLFEKKMEKIHHFLFYGEQLLDLGFICGARFYAPALQ